MPRPSPKLRREIRVGLMAAWHGLTKLIECPTFPKEERHETAVALDLVGQGLEKPERAERAVERAWTRLHAVLKNPRLPDSERSRTATALDLVTQARELIAGDKPS